MTQTTNFSNDDVLMFYKSMPFNYYSSVEHTVTKIRQYNQVPHLAVGLDDILKSSNSMLDVGCGAGWLVNMTAHHYKLIAHGVDFNDVAIARAREVASNLGVRADFFVADLFSYVSQQRYDIVSSVGVLHHTNNALEGVRKILHFVSPGGHILIGLYHKFGRKPFLDYFDALKKTGADYTQLFDEYMKIDSRHTDKTHAESWFRDQVLHVHETQHTLKEVVDIFTEEKVDLISTSINKFEHFQDVNELYSMEPSLQINGHDALREHRYYPGFFMVLGKKHI
jgi:SAM-dependent methyltransferase